MPMAFRSRPMSTRALLRAFQRIGESHGANEAAAESFKNELALLQHKDLDLSVRLGALLAFNALLLTAAINPISASPGAPLSLDAGRQPLEALVVMIGVAFLAASALLCVRAIVLGEEFSIEGIEDDPRAIVQRMFAAYCTSVDAQARFLSLASRLTIAGGAVSAFSFVWIIAVKVLAEP